MKEEGRCRDLREEFRKAKAGLQHENPSLFVKSQWFVPKIYIFWVVFWVLFYTAMIGLDIYYNNGSGGFYLILLTNWSYLLQALHVYLDFGVTIFIHCKHKEIRDGTAAETPWYIKILWVIFNINNVASVLVTILYLTLLDAEFSHGSINKHLLNTVYTILNLLFSAKPVQVLHFYQPMICGCVYILFSIVYHLLGNAPIYTVFDWSDAGKASLLSCLAVFIGIPLMHLVCFSIHTLRLFISQTFQCSGKQKSENEDIKREVTTRDVELQETQKQTRGAINASNAVSPELK